MLVAAVACGGVGGVQAPAPPPPRGPVAIQFGGHLNDGQMLAHAVATHPSGDLIVAGCAHFGRPELRTGGVVVTGWEGYDTGFVGRYDDFGRPRWVVIQPADCSQSSFSAKIAVGSDGAVVVAAPARSAQGFRRLGQRLALPKVREPAAVLARISADGQLQWQHPLPGYVKVKGLGMDADGRLVVTGWFSVTAYSRLENFVARLDTDGTFLWSRTFDVEQPSEEARAYVRDLAVGQGGEIVIAGEAYGKLTLGGARVGGRGSSDVFVAKFTAAGDVAWVRTFGAGSESLHTVEVAVSADGTVLAAGTIAGVEPVELGGRVVVPRREPERPDRVGPYSLFAVKLANGTGASVWSRIFTGVDVFPQLFDLVALPGGDALLGVAHDGALDLGEGLERGGSGVVLVRLAGATGDTGWTFRSGGSGAAGGAALASDGAGAVFVAGAFDGEVIFPGGTLTAETEVEYPCRDARRNGVGRGLFQTPPPDDPCEPRVRRSVALFLARLVPSSP